MTPARVGRLGAGLGLLFGLSIAPGWSEQTRIATSAPSELERGEARGIAVSSRGRLFLAPRITPIGKALVVRDGTDLTMPFDELDTGALPSDRDSTLAVYCRSGTMSAIAVERLLACGHFTTFARRAEDCSPYLS